MPTDFFAPLNALHRPGAAVQRLSRRIVSHASPAGVFNVTAPDSEAQPTHPLECLFEDDAEVYACLEWFQRRQGALTPFWVPSYKQDLTPIGTIGASDTDFDIVAQRYTDALFPLQRRRVIAFVREDGSFVTRTITDAVDNGDDTETLTINESLGQSFTQNNANGICFMWYGRLADDRFQIEWDTGGTASAIFSMIEQNDPPIGGSGSSDDPSIPDCLWIDLTGYHDGMHSGDAFPSPWVTSVDPGLPANWFAVNDHDQSAGGSGAVLTPQNFRLRFLAVGSVVPLGLEASATILVTGLIPGETYIQREIYDKSGDWGAGTGLVTDTPMVANGSGEVTVELSFVNGNDGIIMGYTKWWRKVYLIPPGTEDCVETLL
jgi:hypothetical protein